MPNQEEEGEGDGEISEELGVRGGHAVAFAVHFYNRPVCQSFFLTLKWSNSNAILYRVPQQCARNEGASVGRTFRPLLLNQPLEQEIERLAAHLSHEHEEDLHFAR